MRKILHFIRHGIEQDAVPNLCQVSWQYYRYNDRRLEIDLPHSHILWFESLPDMTSCKTVKKKNKNKMMMMMMMTMMTKKK